jgi:dihydroxy-acid dehydratase
MKSKLRSQNWFEKTGKDGFTCRAWMKDQGIPIKSFAANPSSAFATRGWN